MMNFLRKQSHWLVFLIGLIITGWMTVYVDRQIERKAQDGFNLRVQDMEAAVVRRLRSYEDILYGVAGLYRATDNVTPEQFDLYVESLDINERFPSLKGINFAQYVSQDQRESFIRTYNTNTGGRGITPPKLPTNQSEYMVLTRVHPGARRPALGLEIFQAPGGRLPDHEAGKRIFQLRDYLSNKKVFSSGIPLRPPATNLPGIAARLGIFKPDGNNITQFIGSAGIGFEILSFFKEAIPEKLAQSLHYRMINIGRTDGTRYTSPINMFDSRDLHAGIDPDHFPQSDLLTKHFDIPFGGALFRVEVTEPRSAGIESYEKYLTITVLIGGFLFFGAVSLLLRRMLFDNVALEAAVKKRTIDLQCEVNRTRSLEQELTAVINTERIRIGRELHDDLGQRLTGISLFSEVLASQLLSIDQKLSQQADALEKAASEAMIQVRALAHELVPVSSGKAGLHDALLHLAGDIAKLPGIDCTFDFDDPVDIFDENTSVHLYRIAQEAVNNAIRHAHPTSIHIRLEYEDGKVSLSVSDNGRGFDNKEPKFRSGLGLNTIAQRASIIHYDLKIVSSVGHGTTIKVTEC